MSSGPSQARRPGRPEGLSEPGRGDGGPPGRPAAREAETHALHNSSKPEPRLRCQQRASAEGRGPRRGPGPGAGPGGGGCRSVAGRPLAAPGGRAERTAARTQMRPPPAHPCRAGTPGLAAPPPPHPTRPRPQLLPASPRPETGWGNPAAAKAAHPPPPPLLPGRQLDEITSVGEGCSGLVGEGLPPLTVARTPATRGLAARPGAAALLLPGMGAGGKVRRRPRYGNRTQVSREGEPSPTSQCLGRGSPKARPGRGQRSEGLNPPPRDLKPRPEGWAGQGLGRGRLDTATPQVLPREHALSGHHCWKLAKA